MSITARAYSGPGIRARLSLVALAAGLAAAVVSGERQDPAPQQPPFKSGVQLIEVDVRVFDKDGRFVADLTRGDFDVLEEGSPQRIEAMYLVTDGRESRTGVTVPIRPSSILPAEQPASPAAAQTWIFVFDLNHLTPGGGFDRARTAVEDFIRNSFRDGDLAGVVAGDRMVNNRLTSVREELVGAVAQVKSRDDSRGRLLELTREWPRLLNEEEAIRIARAESEPTQRAVTRACSDDPSQCTFADSAVREKARRLASAFHQSALATLTSVHALASGLARIPGPKTVVLLTDGFVIQDVETTLRSVVGQAARAGARVYAIDVRGLNRGAPGGSLQQLQAVDEAGPLASSDSVADGPNSLAVDTGGMMIRNENNIGRALQRVADDAGRYYVLAYQPGNTTFDGQYRQIQVRVKRDGLRVRARRGYLAIEPSRMLKAQPITASPAKNEESDSAPIGGPPVAATPAVPDSPAPVTRGTIADTPSVPSTGAVRLRPHSEDRIKALEARSTGSSSAASAARRGWSAYERGDVETAFKEFSEASRAGDARPWVLYALGMTQAALGEHAEAIASWERVRQAEPDFPPVYMDLADTYAQVGNLTNALRIVRDAEKRWPSSADVLSAIGVIHVRRGALDEGISALSKAAELNAADALAHLNLARAYALRFHRGRRYVSSQRRWVAPEGDRLKAIESYRRCIQRGGPYAQQAAEELSLLEWRK